MKLTNQFFLAILLLIPFGGCKKEDPYPKVALLCTWPEGYYSGEPVINYVTEVVLYQEALAVNDSIYLLRMPEKIGKLPSGPLRPCNLPEKAKKNGAKIKIGGHVVRFGGFDDASFEYGYPFEITSIEYLDK